MAAKLSSNYTGKVIWRKGDVFKPILWGPVKEKHKQLLEHDEEAGSEKRKRKRRGIRNGGQQEEEGDEGRKKRRKNNPDSATVQGDDGSHFLWPANLSDWDLKEKEALDYRLRL